MGDSWRTPTKRIVRKSPRAPFATRPNRAPTSRTPTIPTASFYTPIRSPPTSQFRPLSPVAFEGNEENELNSEDDEPSGRCIECGSRVSAHAQLCGKTYCIHELPYVPKTDTNAKASEAQGSDEPELSPTPVTDWRSRTMKYPHSQSGTPLHELVARMLHIDVASCRRLYDYTTA